MQNIFLRIKLLICIFLFTDKNIVSDNNPAVTTMKTITQIIDISKQIPLYDNIFYNLYKNCGGKKTRDEYYFNMKTRRTYLFDKIVQLMPSNIVQPKGNLSDFIFI